MHEGPPVSQLALRSYVGAARAPEGADRDRRHLGRWAAGPFGGEKLSTQTAQQLNHLQARGTLVLSRTISLPCLGNWPCHAAVSEGTRLGDGTLGGRVCPGAS